jgi:hypothetical protein
LMMCLQNGGVQDEPHVDQRMRAEHASLQKQGKSKTAAYLLAWLLPGNFLLLSTEATALHAGVGCLCMLFCWSAAALSQQCCCLPAAAPVSLTTLIASFCCALLSYTVAVTAPAAATPTPPAVQGTAHAMSFDSGCSMV